MKYHNSIIGYGWSVLEPLALTITFYILFAILSDDTDPYRPLTILIGILAWSLFAKTLTIYCRSSEEFIFDKKSIFPKRDFSFLKKWLSNNTTLPKLICYNPSFD